MYKKLTDFIAATSNNKALLAIKKGLLMSMPIVIVGTIAIVINNLPLESYQNFMQAIFGNKWKSLGAAIFFATINVTSLVIVTAISYSLADSLNTKKNNHPIIAATVSFINFLLIIQPETQLENIPYDYAGGTGLFVAIATALISTKLFFVFSNIKPFVPKLFTNDPEPILIYAFHSIIPAILTTMIFALFKIGMNLIGIPNFCNFIYDILGAPFKNTSNTLTTAFIYVFMVHFYWLFGIHGGNILNNVNDELYSAAVEKNITNIHLGLAPDEIFTKPFFDAFVMMGGCGSTICLIIAIFIAARKSNSFRLAQISILPGICNVNELLVYGMPIVLNPLYFIPFIFTPLTLTFTSYLAISTGFVPYTSSNIHWTTPPLIGGYAAVKAWQGVALQVFNIGLGTLIYLPFVKNSLRQQDLEMKKSLATLSEIVFAAEPQKVRSIINKTDSTGLISRILANDLSDALKNREVKIFYQPIVDKHGAIVGAEALLRWKHPKYGYIAPPVAIKIAEESDQISQVGAYLFDNVCRQISIWQKNKNLTKFWVSINISVEQLAYEIILTQITTSLDKYKVEPASLKIEVTEQVTLSGAKSLELLSVINSKGVDIAIDDFGMGHSSLQYIKLFPVKILKIDGYLSKDVLNDKNSRGIVRSITDMCQELDIKVVVEFVETLEQKELLEYLNCNFFQGYFYSPALEPERFVEYMLLTQVKKR